MRFTGVRSYWQSLFDNHDLNSFFFSISIRWFGVSLLGIFVAGYLFQIGYTFRWIALFFAIISFTHASTVPLAGRLASTRGVKFLILSSTPLVAIFFLSMELLKSSPLWIAPIAIVGGLSGSIFWTGYHLMFSRKADQRTRGEKISALTFISGLLMIVAPAIGGFLLEEFGFLVVAATTTTIMFLSYIPLIKVPETRIPRNWTTKSLLWELKGRHGVGFIAMGSLSSTIGVVWPLFLFIILDGFVMLGIVSFMTGLFSLLMSLFAGWLNDHLGDKRLLKYSGFAESSLCVVRLFSFVPFLAVIVDALDKTVMRFFALSFDARSYELAGGSHSEKILSREIGLNLGAALSLLIIFFLPYFGIAFTLGAIGALWSMML